MTPTNTIDVKVGYGNIEEIKISRCTIILGSNGSGKSSILKGIASSFSEVNMDYRIAFYEGGRAIQMPQNILASVTGIADTFDRINEQHSSAIRKPFNHRIMIAFKKIDSSTKASKIAHSDRVDSWQKSDKHEECPKRDTTRMEKFIRSISNIFPHITLEYNEKLPDIKVHNSFNNSKYDMNLMSDGEKQVVTLLADMYALEQDSKYLFVVDEPELNLNSSLACRLWDEIELLFPKSRFIYATHCVSFAIRANVETIYVLDAVHRNIRQVNNISEIDSFTMKHFLGAVPAILSASKVLLIEGGERSVDMLFYNWIVKSEGIRVVSVGSCNNVISATNRQDVWSCISIDFKLAGVVDLDFQTENNSDKVATLDYHEVESYLCDPEIGLALKNRLKNNPTEITYEDIVEQIVRHVSNEKITIIARRIVKKKEITSALGLDKNVIKYTTDIDKLIDHIASMADEEINKVSVFYCREAIANELKKEHQLFSSVLNSNDIDQILKLMPAKNIAATLSKKYGCPDSKSAMYAITNQFVPENFKSTKNLKEKIIKAFTTANNQIISNGLTNPSASAV